MVTPFIPSYSFHLVPRAQADATARLMINGVLRRAPTIEIPEDIYWYVVEFLELIATERGCFQKAPIDPPVIGMAGAGVSVAVCRALKGMFSRVEDPFRFINGFGNHTAWKNASLVSIFDRLQGFAEKVLLGGHLIYWSPMMSVIVNAGNENEKGT